MVHVNLGSRSYDIVINEGGTSQAGPLLAAWLKLDTAQGLRVLLVSDAAVFHVHGASVQRSLEAAGAEVRAAIVPSGEQTKSYAQTQALYDHLVDMTADRNEMYNKNKFKLGLFGANCSSGRAINILPERWRADWESSEIMAKMADEAGFDFLLPIGRWKGYGGPTNFQGTTFETITWATGLLAHTKRITVFGTVHAPLFNPMVAAKQMVTADHVGRGRFALNIVVGWNEPEFQMSGIRQREHGDRYDYAAEWISAIKRMWSEDEPFDFHST
ncbi:MAG: LLM class flavin-dependent oxidoreductase, partial [Planctomycetota bacterium]